MNHLKSAFAKVKKDIYFLGTELSNLKFELNEIKHLLKGLHELINSERLKEIAGLPISKYPTDRQTDTPTHFPTLQHKNPTNTANPTHNPTLRQEIEGLKSQILSISTGNRGVPTDRQTNRQTHQQTHNYTEKSPNSSVFNSSNPLQPTLETNIQEASEILDSLDRLKKEIRLKFKRITNQEMAVFSTIYQLEDQDFNQVTYKKVAQTLNLSESSIRDYVQRIINKGIPIKKHKINNKTILLSISQELKKIASLSTIIQLREL
jgi:hypothetical protein